MKTELTEPLISAIYTDLYERLSTLFRFSDDEISALGLGCLVTKSNEQSEKILKEFSFVYTESWRGIFTISAHNRDEAIEIFEKMTDNGEIIKDKLKMIDSDWYLRY